MDLTDHKIIAEQEIIEKYILCELPDETQEAFEEHMLFCQDCRNEYHRLNNIIIATESVVLKQAFTKHKKSAGKQSFLSKSWKIAAGIAIIVGLSFIFINHIKNKQTSEISYIDTIPVLPTEKNQILSSPHPDSISNKKPEQKDIERLLPPDTYTEAFTPLLYLEGAIKNQLRGSSVNVRTPAINEAYKNPFALNFNWDTDYTGSISLVIKNNQGQTVFDSIVAPPYKNRSVFKKGLYYWQLNTEDETLYTGKFRVR